MKMKIERYSGVSKAEHEAEPVYYCKSCLSLHIIAAAKNGDDAYCKDCGGSALGKTNMDFWAASYRLRYGKDFLTGLDIPYNEECKHCTLKK